MKVGLKSKCHPPNCGPSSKGVLLGACSPTCGTPLNLACEGNKCNPGNVLIYNGYYNGMVDNGGTLVCELCGYYLCWLLLYLAFL